MDEHMCEQHACMNMCVCLNGTRYGGLGCVQSVWTGGICCPYLSSASSDLLLCHHPLQGDPSALRPHCKDSLAALDWGPGQVFGRVSCEPCNGKGRHPYLAHRGRGVYGRGWVDWLSQ